ncbi:MAG: tRNA epoxyqueuosine(34) reductase QueG [Phycisphaerae bacterium]|nr:tRNA epoxyqueuosine(34) reductase QueG [Phycisphaerae bacterium]
MTPADRSDWIKSAALQLGFDRCGIAVAGPIERMGFLREWLARGYTGTMAYLHRHRASRVDVRAWLPWAQSVIVAALNYRQPDPSDAARRDADPKSPISNPQSPISNLQSPIEPRGRVAMYAWGEDYHAVVRDKLDTLVARMREMFDEPFKAKVCVDTSAIVERELAAAAGIGWIGKNTMVLHASLGSFFFLGEIVTDLPLAPDTPEPDRCGTCTRCLEACPTGALVEPHVMDASRCISYLTIEHRGDIAQELAARMGNWVFGCDVCQTVCPFNGRAPESTERRFDASLYDAHPQLDDVLSWDEAAYESRVEGKATNRATLHMWKRNAEIARRNATR